MKTVGNKGCQRHGVGAGSRANGSPKGVGIRRLEPIDTDLYVLVNRSKRSSA